MTETTFDYHLIAHTVYYFLTALIIFLIIVILLMDESKCNANHFWPHFRISDLAAYIVFMQFGRMSANLLSLFRGHHAHHVAVGRGRVWQGVQPFHSRPALGACRRHAARAEACHCRERTLLGHWL